MFSSINSSHSHVILPGLGGNHYQSKYTKSTRPSSPAVNRNPQLSSVPRAFSRADQGRRGNRRPRVPFGRKEEAPRVVSICDARGEVEESSSSHQDTTQAPQSQSHELLIKIEEQETRIRHLEKDFAMAQDRIKYLESRYNMARNRVEAMEEAVREIKSTLLTPTCCVHCALERVETQCDDLLRVRGGEGDCLLCLESSEGELRDCRGSVILEAKTIKSAALLPSLESLLDSRSRRIYDPQEPIFPMASASYRFPPPPHDSEDLFPMASPSYRFPPPCSEPTSEDISSMPSSSYTFPEPSTEPSSDGLREAGFAHTSPVSSGSKSLPPLELSIAEEMSRHEISLVFLDSTDVEDVMELKYGKPVGEGWRRLGIRSSTFPDVQRTGIRKREHAEEDGWNDVGLDHIGKRARTVC